MVAQCIEQFFYGGVGNFIKKKERVYDEPVQMDGDYKYVDDEESSEGASVTDSMKEEMIKRGLWKEKKSHRKGTGKNALEGIEEKDGEEEEEGKEGEDDEEEEGEEEEEETGEKEEEMEGIEQGGEGALLVEGQDQEGIGLLPLTDNGDEIHGQEHDNLHHVSDIEAPPGGTSNESALDTGTGLVVYMGDGTPIGPNGEPLDVIEQGERIEGGDIETGSYNQQVRIYSLPSFLPHTVYCTQSIPNPNPLSLSNCILCTHSEYLTI